MTSITHNNYYKTLYMKKIVYPILLLALVACKGNQQTTDDKSSTSPVAEMPTDTIAQPEVDAITSATSKPNQVSFNGRIVLPPQRQATIALTMGGIIKKPLYCQDNGWLQTVSSPH